MLHWSLARHSRLWGSAESDFMFEWVKGTEQAWAVGNEHGELHWLPREKVNREEFFSFAGTGIDAMYRSRSGGLQWLEQTPRYVFLYDQLRLMFPGTLFIHIIRDGRHAVDSMQRQFDWSFGRCMRTWKRHVEAGLTASESGYGDVLQLHYEDLVTDSVTTMDTVFAFIGLDPESACLEALETPVNASRGRENESPLQKLDPERLAWGFLQTTSFRLACGPLQHRLGYS